MACCATKGGCVSAVLLSALIGAAAPAITGCGANAAADVIPAGFDHGWAHVDCAPFDGPATRIIFDAGPRMRLTLLLNRPLTDSAGRWPLGNDSRGDGVAAAECAGERGPCSRASAGELRIEAASPQRLRGTFNLRFGDSTRTGRFDVPVVGLTAICG